jgi:Co/Zn/Cd efflux system component
MNKTTFSVAKMDCPSEEQMIRMKLEPFAFIKSMQFDIPNRTLEIYHEGEINEAETALLSLNLDAEKKSTIKTEAKPVDDIQVLEKNILIAVLLINFGFFVIEIAAGFIAASMGLVGDSLDMLADAIVYGLSLLAVGKALSYKKSVAKLSGWFQFSLAVLGFAEVIRRFLGYGEIPIFQIMIIISAFALIGNVISLILINKAKSREAHMQASAIFTSNDIIVNIGVMLAGVLVLYTNTRYPDLIIGAILFLVVARGAFRILKLSK